MKVLGVLDIVVGYVRVALLLLVLIDLTVLEHFVLHSRVEVWLRMRGCYGLLVWVAGKPVWRWFIVIYNSGDQSLTIVIAEGCH